MEKTTNKAKFEFLKFFVKSVFIAYDKIEGNYALPENSIKICLLGNFYMQNSNLQ